MRSTDSPSGPPAVLRVVAQPANPLVIVDGASMGNVEHWPESALPVPAGERRLELRVPGYYPYRRDLTLDSGRTYTLEVHLVRRLE